MDMADTFKGVNDLTGLNNLKEFALDDPQAALREAANQFESLFVEMMVKEMRKTEFDGDGLLNTQQTRYFQQWYDSQLVQEVSAKGGFGLADNIVEELSPPSMKTHDALAVRQNIQQLNLSPGQ